MQGGGIPATTGHVVAAPAGAAATLPAPQRQAALDEAGHGFKCTCARCQLEERASEGVRDTLQVCVLRVIIWSCDACSDRAHKQVQAPCIKCQGTPVFVV